MLSTDAAHSLADAFGCAPGTIGAEPTEVADRLFVQQVDAQLRFEQSWADIQRYLLSVLDVAVEEEGVLLDQRGGAVPALGRASSNRGHRL